MTQFDLLKSGMESCLASGEWYSKLLCLFFVISSCMWLFLPFAIFGIKSKLDEIINELKKDGDTHD